MKNESADLLKSMRVAAPCPASWEAMEGDARVRFCRLCDLHVYNFSELTRAEAESLVARTEGRLCGRLYRRADGTVLTKDCPTGLRAARRRVGRAAAAAFAALLGLCGGAFGQSKSKADDAPDTGKAKVTRAVKTGKGSSLKGVVLDPNGAVIHGASVVVTEKTTRRQLKAATSGEGAFAFAALPPGVYEVEVSAPYGLKTLKMAQLAVGQDEAVGLDLALDVNPAQVTVMVGVIAVGDFIDTSHPRNGNGITTFNSKQVTNLPIP